ncbi:MAG TPA: PEP-CTERM sorting domain-containing protein, partial [Candidatus Obscuribacterales bacterium]
FLEVDSSTFGYAGYGIDTKEIDGSQKVGSLGINLKDLGVNKAAIAGIQVVSKANYNGPDFKIVGAKTESVPEPAAMAGLGLAVGALVSTRRRKATQAS